MKKIFTYLCAIFMCVVSAIGLSSCGNNVTVTDAEVVSGIETTIVKNTELDTSNILVKIKYSDDTTESITSADLEFGTIDTTTAGNKDLTIKHTKSGYEFTIVIRVVEDEADLTPVYSLDSALVNEFNAHTDSQTNKETEFYDREQPLYVGDDNAFNFRLNAVDYEEDSIDFVRTNVVVKLVEGETKTELTGEELDRHVAIDTINAKLDFTEYAIGKVYEVTVSAANRDSHVRNDNQVKFTAELHVIDGFNVYDATDLSVYDNKYYYLKQSDKDENYRTHQGYTTKHQAVANKYGLTLDDIKAIKNIILQKDIVIEDKDLLDEFFWQINPADYATKTNQKIIGSLINKDHEGLYYRFVGPNDDFQFIGNYFGVDASRISKMVLEISENSVSDADQPYVCVEDTSKGFANQNIKVSCSTLFYTTGMDASRTGVAEEEGAKITWKNLNFFGNGNLNSDPRNSGAVLLSKFAKAEMEAYNNISRSFLISYLVREYNDGYQDNEATFWFDHCKVYECYQSHLYIAGTNDGVTVSDCEFKRANGPSIMVDFIIVDEDDPTTGVPSYVNIINSKVESLVTGQEPWLRTYGADAMVGEMQRNNVFFTGNNPMSLPNTGKTMVLNPETDVYQMNAMVFVKGDTADPTEANRIYGYVRIFGENADPYDETKSQQAWAKYEAQDDNYQALQLSVLKVLALTAQYNDDTKDTVIGVCQQAVGAYMREYGITDPDDVDSLTQMAISQTAATQKFAEYLQAKIGAALVAAEIDPEDEEQMASAEAQQVQLGVIVAQAQLANGITSLSTFIHDLADISGQELQMMSLVSYISAVQGIMEADPEHDMPVFGLDFGSTFNWAGAVGLADAAYDTAAILQSASSGGYLSAAGIITCMPYEGAWAGGANYFDGEYLNIYNDTGVGIILQLYPQQA